MDQSVNVAGPEGKVGGLVFCRLQPLNEKHCLKQAVRFMVGPGHCPMISKYGPSLSKAVDPFFLVVKISHFNKNIHLIASLQNRKYMYVGCQYSKTCLKQPLKEDKI